MKLIFGIKIHLNYYNVYYLRVNQNFNTVKNLVLQFNKKKEKYFIGKLHSDNIYRENNLCKVFASYEHCTTS